MRGPNNFNKNDFKRAIRAAREAELPIARVEVNREGTISLVVGKPVPAASGDESNEWDRDLDQNQSQVR